MKEWLMSYLTFSRKERTGILMLMGLILVIWLLPKYYVVEEKIDGSTLAKADSAVKSRDHARSEVSVVKFSLFYFDPNTISDEQWAQLGLRSRTISTIRNYLSKGGRFRQASDIEKIYGMKKDDAVRLIPYVRIKEQAKSHLHFHALPPLKYPTRSQSKFVYTKRTYEKRSIIVDLNKADSLEFEAMPGIGIKLASRIVRFRESLGGFHSIEQLKDVYGIDDSLFNLIRPSLKLHGGIFRKVKINSWNADSLDLHPYIQKHQARAIVKFREQHGRFGGKEDLAAIAVIDPAWLSKLEPYFEFN